MEWLDNITTITENKTFGYVQLQGPDDQYNSWHDVETYQLPDTPLSTQNGPENLDGIHEAFERNLGLRSSVGQISTESNASGAKTPSTVQSKSRESSPGMTEATPAKDNAGQSATHYASAANKSQIMALDGNTGGVPARVRPLLNFVVWRTYHQDPSIGGTERYILLTNDSATQKQAQKFGVRAKLLSQVSAIMAKAVRRPVEPEDALSANGVVPDAERVDTGDSTLPDDVQEDYDEEIVFKPQRPLSMSGRSGANLWDPNHFGRLPASPATQAAALAAPTVPLQSVVPPSPRHSPRLPDSPLYSRGGGGPSRGGFGSPHGRGQSNNVPIRGGPRLQYNKPIDPNSYARPSPSAGRGRGGRKLWQPNT